MFKKVDRTKNRLRLALEGPAGAGKTYTALRFAFAVAAKEGLRVAVIDSEHHSASLYAGESPDGVPWEWDGVQLEHFAPSNYSLAIREAARAGYGVLVIDSLSHAWMGKGGALDQVDRANSAAGGRFGAWRDVTPQHNELVDSILRYPGHVICTMRQKTEHVIETDERGRSKVVRMGLKPIQREGVEYEFTLVCDLDLQHRLTVAKTRCSIVDGQIVSQPSGDWILPVVDWLYQGVDEPRAIVDQLEATKKTAASANVDPATLRAAIEGLGAAKLAHLSPEDADKLLGWVRSKATPANEQPAESEPGKGIRLSGKALKSDPAPQARIDRLKELWKANGHTREELVALLEEAGVEKLSDLPESRVEEVISELEMDQLLREAEEAF